MILYKKGYLIRVTSWENDADNYNTKEIQADTETEAKEIVAFAKLFESRSRNKNGIGNINRDSEWEKAKEVLWDFYQNNRVTFTEECKDSGDACEYMLEVAYELGLGGSEYFMTRVCDTVKVLYFAEDVNAEEVTF